MDTGHCDKINAGMYLPSFNFQPLLSVKERWSWIQRTTARDKGCLHPLHDGPLMIIDLSMSNGLRVGITYKCQLEQLSTGIRMKRGMSALGNPMGWVRSHRGHKSKALTGSIGSTIRILVNDE